MFREHQDSIWGRLCSCGSEVYILQNKFHPWQSTDFIARIPCPNCGLIVDVDISEAAAYYNEKIYSRFCGIRGTILDLGCGGGFLTEHILTLPGVTRVIALDNDPGCREAMAKLGDARLEFVLADAKQLGTLYTQNSIDYIVSRDLFMFIEDTEEFFANITRIVRRGIRQMGWHKQSTQRMKNVLTPEEIRSALTALGWNVELEYLEWYKAGYYIRANK